jgi:hypothetical protein
MRGLFQCVNPECSWAGVAGGEAELPEIDPNADPEGPQTDSPICCFCFEPMELKELVEIDPELTVYHIEEMEHAHGLEGVEYIIEMATARAAIMKEAGESEPVA